MKLNFLGDLIRIEIGGQTKKSAGQKPTGVIASDIVSNIYEEGKFLLAEQQENGKWVLFSMNLTFIIRDTIYATGSKTRVDQDLDTQQVIDRIYQNNVTSARKADRYGTFMNDGYRWTYTRSDSRLWANIMADLRKTQYVPGPAYNVNDAARILDVSPRPVAIDTPTEGGALNF